MYFANADKGCIEHNSQEKRWQGEQHMLTLYFSCVTDCAIDLTQRISNNTAIVVLGICLCQY